VSAPQALQSEPFRPRRWLSNAHLQTIAGNILPRPNTLPSPTVTLVEVNPAHGTQIASQLLCECYWQPTTVRSAAPTAIILHGLEGSSRSQYVLGNAAKLFHAGANVLCMNMRNCGPRGPHLPDPQALTPTLYHSGLSSDVALVLHHFIAAERLQSVALIGYSMGGNLVLKLAGELGTNAPPQLRSIIGVSPACDLASSADALHDGFNRFYERRFLRALIKRFRRKATLFPRAFDPNLATGLASLRQFDDRITALYSGFLSADDYYHRAAAARVLASIAVPTLILHAADDPFIRITPTTRDTIANNPNITLIEPARGGHCAFLEDPTPTNDGYWAEHTALRFLLQHAGPSPAPLS
jgi:predicted alpha/beta-fold hydrolase